MSKEDDLIEKAILRRAARRNVTPGISRYRYSNEIFFEHIPPDSRKSALYVGIGNGLDALLALLNNYVTEVTGVDPYVEDDGSDDRDLAELLDLVRQCGLEKSFNIEKATIDAFLSQNTTLYDLIVCRDVLHHIFITNASLSRSTLSGEATAFFANLLGASSEKGTLAIDEVDRYGLRQVMTKYRLLKGNVRYDTKQSWREWTDAAVKGGWSFMKLVNRVPYPFRSQAWMWSGLIGKYTACDRYGLYFTAKPLR